MIKYKQFLESIQDKGKFKAIFLAGTPASGKSTISNQMIGVINPKFVNTDIFTREYYGINKETYDVFSGSIPEDLRHKSKLLLQNQLSLYINSMLPLIIDSTSSSPSLLLKRKGILESCGYDVGVIFVDTSLETAIRRNKDRGVSGKGSVPEDFIKRTHEKLQQMKSFYREHFKFYKEVHNDANNAYDINLNRIYKDTQTFFTSDLKNPIGINIIEELKNNNKKYLDDTKEFHGKVNNIASHWYLKT